MISGMSNAHRRPRDRFDYEDITAEIQAFIDRNPRGTQQRLAEAVFPEASPRDATSAFRHRMDEYRGERFSFEELGRVAVEAGKLLGKAEGAPTGWPFISWREADAVDGVLRALHGSRS